MTRKLLVFVLMMALTTSVAMALPQVQKASGSLVMPPMLDTFDDTLVYDDGIIALWYGPLTDFRLATRFTPLVDFEMQQILVAFYTSGPTPVELFLKDDNNGLPGDSIYWSGTLLYSWPQTWIPVTVDTTGLYTFTAGEDFWIEVFSPGPPYEMFDASATLPQRSYIMAWGLPIWDPSPGDNFIRAVGEYASTPNDVGVDSVWHDEHFFVTNGSSFSIGARVTNYSAIPAIFDVGCVIYTEEGENLYVYYDSLTVQSATLVPGASEDLAFPAYTWNSNDRYKIDVRTYWDQDSNPDNNNLATETQVYTSPAELRYDDTQPDGSAISSQADFGWGMKFDPHLTGEYTISTIKVHTATGDSVARIQVLSDLGSAPGQVLWENVTEMANGWNEFTVGAVNTGAFYIFYMFEHGDSSPALSRDGYPLSGQAWQKDGVIFSPDFTAQDWAMRVNIEGGSVYPSWAIDTWLNGGSPVPVGGGNLEWGVYAENTSGQVLNGDIWVDVVHEGTTTTTVIERALVNYQPGWAVNRPDNWYPVPGGWPGGNYEWYVRTGVRPGVIWEEDSFAWSKDGPVDLDFDFATNLPTASFPNPFDEIIEGTADLNVPTSFEVMGAYPNPFNPMTTISFTLPQQSKVLLSVFDVSGRMVTTLVDGYRATGVYDVTFDASRLASGIYLYRLEAGDFNATGKMVLMK